MCAALMRKLPPVPSAPGGSYVVQDRHLRVEPDSCYISPATRAQNAAVGGLLRHSMAEEEQLPSSLGLAFKATMRDLNATDAANIRNSNFSNMELYSTSAFRAELREVEKLFECLRDTRDVGRDAGHGAMGTANPATIRESRPAVVPSATQRADDPPDPWSAPSPPPPNPQRQSKKSALTAALSAARERKKEDSLVSHATVRPSSGTPALTLERLTRFAAPCRTPQQTQKRRVLQQERAEKVLERRVQLERDFYARLLEEVQATDEQAQKAALGKKSREKAEVVRMAKLRRGWLCAVTSAMIAMRFNQARQHWKDLQYAALAESAAVA